MKVVVTSREMIKPSRPTPDHLRRLPFSYLDQIQQPHFMPFFYFYASDKDAPATRCEQLRRSLAETLTWFYPLAGRVMADENCVHCNDEGVPYFEARVEERHSLLQFRRDHALINFLLPPYDLDCAGDLPLAIQVNLLDCGAIAIGVALTHKVTDALSILMFVKYWAAISRGDHGSIPRPKFGFADLFPPNPSFMASYREGVGNIKERVVPKRFVISSAAISALKAKYATSTTPHVSTVEALTTFIWSRFAAATRATHHVILQTMNLRIRLSPAVQDSHIGNCSRFASAFISTERGLSGAGETDYGLVIRMREAIREIDNNYVRKLVEGNEGARTSSDYGLAVPIVFTSLIRFPIYETDFGWGRPIWVTYGVLNYQIRMVVFMPKSSGDGVEVLIYMKEADQGKLLADKEFLMFVSTSTDDAPILALSSL